MTSILRATTSDVADIMEFIDTEWNTGHVLSQSRKLFLWQYQLSGSEELNFVLARNGKKIVGILGFTLNSQYSISGIEKDIKWLSMWKVTSDAKKGTGLHLLENAESLLPTFGIGTVGCNEKVLQIYKSLGYQTGKLSHFYYPNHEYNFNKPSVYSFSRSELSENREIPCDIFVKTVKEKKDILEKLDFHLSMNPDLGNFKSSEYIFNRYLENPFYKYQFRLLLNSNSDELGFLIFRVAETPKGNVLRVLELVTSKKNINLTPALDNLLNINNCQYADFFTHSLYGDAQDTRGFLEVKSSMNLPNLFEPLNHLKSSIFYALKLNHQTPIQISRGDCDQDRPNTLK